MALTQIQIIQSLGEAMNWLEREISWNVKTAELRHLVGRIGELYAALMTSGQMAPETNQAGYDIVSSTGERVSVKTTTQGGGAGHLSFNPNTLGQVDRIMVFFLNIEEMQVETLLDSPTSEAVKLMSGPSQGKLHLSLSKLRGSQRKTARPVDEQKVVASATHKNSMIQELESGTILVVSEGTILPQSKPALRMIAAELGISIENSNGNLLNTRQLGSYIIRHLSQ